MLSFNELDLFYDESDDDGSDSGSPGTCPFPFFSGKYVGSVSSAVGSVSCVGYEVFVLTGIESIGYIVPLVMSLPKGVNSKGG